MDNDEWIIVGKSKNNKKEKKNKVAWNPGSAICPENLEGELESFLHSECMENNKMILTLALNQMGDKVSNVHLECLGLGNFIAYYKPRIQFYFLIHLLIPIVKNLNKPYSVNSFDPVFTAQCQQQLQINNITYNPKKLKPDASTLTIYFMPHCQRFLYEEICILQTEPALILGNSLQEYRQRCKMLGQAVPQALVQKLQPETPLTDYKQCLNDTYLYKI